MSNQPSGWNLSTLGEGASTQLIADEAWHWILRKLSLYKGHHFQCSHSFFCFLQSSEFLHPSSHGSGTTIPIFDFWPLIFSLASRRLLFFSYLILSVRNLQQKVVLKVMTMTDDKTKQKAMEAAADIYGISNRFSPLISRRTNKIFVFFTQVFA